MITPPLLAFFTREAYRRRVVGGKTARALTKRVFDPPLPLTIRQHTTP